MVVIDYAVDIFDELAQEVLGLWPDVFVSNEYVRAPPMFPAVSIIEQSNVPLRRREDSSGEENAVTLTYQIDVYATEETGANDACKRIHSVIDNRMRLRNMLRISCGPVQNPDDQSIYRITARYQGVIDKEGTHFRR